MSMAPKPVPGRKQKQNAHAPAQGTDGAAANRNVPLMAAASSAEPTSESTMLLGQGSNQTLGKEDLIAAPTAASEVYSALMTLREHDEGMPVSVETLKRIQLDLAAVSLHVMESGVNLLTQQDPQQTRDHLHQLAEQARHVGLANSAHAELPGAAASSYGTYEAEGEAGSLEYMIEKLREEHTQDMAAFFTRRRDLVSQLDTQLQQEEEHLQQNFNQRLHTLLQAAASSDPGWW